MASRRVRQVGRVRWVRLTTGERISQCGRFLIRGPAHNVIGKAWRVWYRDPAEVCETPPEWNLLLHETSRLRYALDAAGVFDRAVRTLKLPRLLDGFTEAKHPGRYGLAAARARKQAGLVAIAQAENAA